MISALQGSGASSQWPRNSAVETSVGTHQAGTDARLDNPAARRARKRRRIVTSPRFIDHPKGRAGPSEAMNRVTPNSTMIKDPPMAQRVHTALAQRLLAPPSLRA